MIHSNNLSKFSVYFVKPFSSISKQQQHNYSAQLYCKLKNLICSQILDHRNAKRSLFKKHTFNSTNGMPLLQRIVEDKHKIELRQITETPNHHQWFHKKGIKQMFSKEEVSKVVSGMKHTVYSFHTLGMSKFSHIFGIHTYSRQTKECKLQQQEQQQKAS